MAAFAFATNAFYFQPTLHNQRYLRNGSQFFVDPCSLWGDVTDLAAQISKVFTPLCQKGIGV
jgi:hypothetical protein